MAPGNPLPSQGSRRSLTSFRVLGPVEALRDGRSLPLGGPRQRALLALLLVERGRPVSPNRLIDEIWAGEPPEAAARTLLTYVSRLRSALGDETLITQSAAGYGVEAVPDQIDSRRFEELVQGAELALTHDNPRKALDVAREALALWRSAPFGDLGREGSLRLESERLEELRLLVTEVRFEADIALGGGASLVVELEALVGEHPTRERLWRLLMLALYRSGRQADALEAYRVARAALAEQLGIEPGEELERLQREILRHEVTEPDPTPARVSPPAHLTSFIGRDGQLSEIVGLLASTRMVTLVGVGGVGKTRLALEAARMREREHASGVAFIDLAPLADPDLLPAHVASGVHIREDGSLAPIDRLTSGLRNADVLLILDNCEHLLAACAALAAALLHACPGVHVLATSRERLGVPGEIDHPVPPLGLPEAGGPPEALRTAEAVRLFLARAREARPDIPEDDATIATIGRICADLDGLPLAIELAAARARALSPAEIAARLHDRFRFLVSRRRVAATRHRTLREAMDWSHELLDEVEQRVLRRVSVFAGGFGLDAVAAVCAQGDEDRAAESLRRLVEASLVTVDPSPDRPRYGILETVRQYGAERLAAAGEEDAIRRLHAAHFTRFAEAAWRPIRSPWVPSDWMERTAVERDNLRAALGWLEAASDYDAMLRIAESLWWFWWHRGEPSEGRAWLERALANAGASDAELRGLAHLGIGGLAWVQGDNEAAEEHSSIARRLFAELDDAAMEGSALNNLGLVASRRNDASAARGFFEAAIERFNAAPDDLGMVQRNVAVTIDNLGSAAQDLGDAGSALAFYREALALNRARDDREGIAMNELHLALVEAEQGRLQEARRLLASALAVYRAADFKQYAAECLEAASVIANGVAAPRRAAFLLGAAARLRDDGATPPVPLLARIRVRETAAAEAALGSEVVAACQEEARRMPSDAAMQLAMAFLEAPGPD